MTVTAPPAVPGSDRSRSLGIAWGLGLFALAVVVPLLRQQGNRSWEVIWAEDGAIYYQQLVTHGIATLWLGYDGYLQFLPRLLILPAAWVPIEALPRYTALASTATCAVLATLVYRWSAGHIASRPVRLTLAAMYVVAPQMREDGTANLANLITPVMAVVPWALLSRSRGRGDVVGRAATLVVAGLTSVLAMAFLPLAWALAARRRAEATVLALASSVACAVQVALMQIAPPRHPAAGNDVGQLVQLSILNVGGSWLLGEEPLTALWRRGGTASLVVLALAATAVLAVAQLGASPPARVTAAVFVTYAALTYAVSLWANGTMAVGIEVGRDPNLTYRYSIAPAAFLVAAVAVLVDAPDPSRDRRLARIGRVLLVAHVVVVVATSYRDTNHRSRAPLWADAVARGRATCVAGHQGAVLPIAPSGWVTVVPCSELETGTR